MSFFSAVRQSSIRVLSGLLGKDQSIATGLLIGLIIWTITRLVDGITASGTIEYDTVYAPTTLANGTPGTKIEVTLTNLSSETAVNNLQVSIADPSLKTIFSTNSLDSSCVFEPPAWRGDAVCEPHSIGMSFMAPMLVPGTFVRVGIKYVQAAGASQFPVVTIKPDGTTKFRLVQPGVQTFVARHEVALLLGLLFTTLVLFGISVGAGVPKTPS